MIVAVFCAVRHDSGGVSVLSVISGGGISVLSAMAMEAAGFKVSVSHSTKT